MKTKDGAQFAASSSPKFPVPSLLPTFKHRFQVAQVFTMRWASSSISTVFTLHQQLQQLTTHESLTETPLLYQPFHDTLPPSNSTSSATLPHQPQPCTSPHSQPVLSIVPSLMPLSPVPCPVPCCPPVPCPKSPALRSLSQVSCQLPVPCHSSLSQFPASSSLSQVFCPEFPVPSLLPSVPCHSSLSQFPASSSLSQVFCPKFPVPSLLPSVPCHSSLSQFPAPSSLSQVFCSEGTKAENWRQQTGQEDMKERGKRKCVKGKGRKGDQMKATRAKNQTSLGSA